MLTTRWACASLLATGLALLLYELSQSPRAALVSAGVYATVWLVRQRLLRKPHHHHGFHRARREILTSAATAALLVAILSLVLTAVELGAAPGPQAGDDQLPWAARFLVNGIGTIVGVGWLLVGARGLHRRARHGHGPVPVDPG